MTRQIKNFGFYLSSVLLVLVTHSIWKNLNQRDSGIQQLKIDKDIKSLTSAIALFHHNHDYYPEELDDLTKENQYLAEIPRDPWGNTYIYKQPGSGPHAAYEIISTGSDGRMGGSGDNSDRTYVHY